MINKSRVASSARRGFRSRASGLGAATVGAIATTWTDAPASVDPLYGEGCCNVAHPNGPFCGGRKNIENFTCPSGYHKRAWYCHTAHFYYTCLECAAGSNCYSGPFACSNYYAVYVP